MRNRTRRSRSAPVIATLEQIAFTAADTVVNTTLYAPPISTTAPLQRWNVRVRGMVTTITDGDVTSFRAYAIIRRVPAGYSAPSITIASTLTAFADVDNVLAYGLYSGTDTRDSVQWRWLKRSASMMAGDVLTIQVVADSASANRAFSAVIEYDISSA